MNGKKFRFNADDLNSVKSDKESTASNFINLTRQMSKQGENKFYDGKKENWINSI